MKVKIFRMFIVLAFAKALLSCNTESQLESEIKAIPLDVELIKFHEEFSNSNSEDLPKLKAAFPLFFPEKTPDSIWNSKLNGQDTIYNVLDKAVKEAKFDYDQIEEEVEDVMRHVVYYFPDFEPTSIVTVLSEVNYRQKVIPLEDQLIISIDTYLGQDHELYLGINKYQRENLNREQLPADVALAYSRLFVNPTFDRSLLSNMIYHGKLHYLQELFAPHTTGNQRFNYTPVKYKFTVENESQMWRYFIDNELIYKTDSKLLSRFILPAPFSKFYLEVDQETPGGVGRYIGYRMVKSFMENNEVDIETMIQLNAEDIFERSKYKPLQ